MTKKYFCYKITNLKNNKIYIGKTDNIKIRWREHKTAAKFKYKNDYGILHRAISKYGPEYFQIEQISEHLTEKEAFDQEILFIKIFQSKNRNIGYNMTDGGDGPSGFKHSEETKKLMSFRKSGMFIGKENPFYGQKHSEETKQLLAIAAKNRYEENIEKYNKLNLNQCDFNTEQCLEIQKEYISKNITFKELAEKNNTNLYTIHSIIHGIYFAIKNDSIITKERFNSIKHSRKTKFSEQEKELIKLERNSGISIKELSEKWKASKPTIRKIINN